MEIKIRRIDGHFTNGDHDRSDVTHTYRVMDNGNEFTITFRSHRHGSALCIAGQKGVLYTDRDADTVHRHVVAIGEGCGIRIESDELVDGLSVWSIRGIIFADRREETREITLIIEGPESYHQPVVLIDGETTDLHGSL